VFIAAVTTLLALLGMFLLGNVIFDAIGLMGSDTTEVVGA